MPQALRPPIKSGSNVCIERERERDSRFFYLPSLAFMVSLISEAILKWSSPQPSSVQVHGRVPRLNASARA